MTWSVALRGDTDAIEELAGLLSAGEIRIEREGRTFLLLAERLDRLNDADEVFEVAEKLLREINGLALLYLSEPSSLSISQITRTTEVGADQGFLQFRTEAVLRGPKAGPRYRPDLFVDLVTAVSF